MAINPNQFAQGQASQRDWQNSSPTNSFGGGFNNGQFTPMPQGGPAMSYFSDGSSPNMNLNSNPSMRYTPTPMPQWGGMNVPQPGSYGQQGGMPQKGYTSMPNFSPGPSAPSTNMGAGAGGKPIPSGFQSAPQSPNWFGQSIVDPALLGSRKVWEDKNSRDWMMNMQPWAQMQINSGQWGQQFDEGNQRYWDESAWGKQRDTFGMGLSARQQQMAEWQAQQAANQWGAQFGREGLRDDREWDLGNRQFGLQQQLGLGELGVKQGQLDVNREANSIDQMWKAGQLSNQQRELALAELAQSQKYGIESGRLSLDTMTQKELTDYRNRQLAQEAQVAREQMANQQQIATMSAYGRAQAPNTRWARSW